MNLANLTEDKLFERLKNNKSKKNYWDNIRELRRRGTKTIFKTCTELANSENKKLIRIAIYILGQLGTPSRPFGRKTVLILLRLIKKKKNDSELKSEILFELSRINEFLNIKEINNLVKYKDNKNYKIRLNLVHAIGGVEKQIVVDTLIYLMQDENAKVRNWATFSIGTLSERNNKK